jgi:hypothetical protein
MDGYCDDVLLPLGQAIRNANPRIALDKFLQPWRSYFGEPIPLDSLRITGSTMQCNMPNNLLGNFLVISFRHLFPPDLLPSITTIIPNANIAGIVLTRCGSVAMSHRPQWLPRADRNQRIHKYVRLTASVTVDCACVLPRSDAEKRPAIFANGLNNI